MQPVDRRYTTGLPFLDQRIDGGIPIRSTVVFRAPPESQAQLFLRDVTGTRPRHYISTDCPDERELLTSVTREEEDSDTTVSYANPADLLSSPTEVLERGRPESFVVIDAIDQVERASYTEYVTFLTELKRWIRETDSVAFLHCHECPDEPPRRSITLNRADHIWSLKMELRSQSIAYRLYVTKARKTRALVEPVPLLLTDQVRVDTTRNI